MTSFSFPRSAGALLLACLTACGGSGSVDPAAVLTVGALPIVFELGNDPGATSTVATAADGVLPAQSGGPAFGSRGLDAAGTRQTRVQVGGTVDVHLGTADASITFDEILVAASGRSGFYRLRFPSPRTSAIVRAFVAPTFKDTSLTLIFQVGRNGLYSAPAGETITVAPFGTDTFAAELTWSNPVPLAATPDLDVQVVDPRGDVLQSITRTRTDIGAELSSTGCGVAPTLEHATWRAGAPLGQYAFNIYFGSTCGVTGLAASYTLRLLRNGAEISRSTGTIYQNPTSGQASTTKILFVNP